MDVGRNEQRREEWEKYINKRKDGRKNEMKVETLSKKQRRKRIRSNGTKRENRKQ